MQRATETGLLMHTSAHAAGDAGRAKATLERLSELDVDALWVVYRMWGDGSLEPEGWAWELGR